LSAPLIEGPMCVDTPGPHAPADPTAEPPVETAEAGAVPTAEPADVAFKLLVKDAVADALREQRSLLESIMEEALAEMAFAEAVREVEAHERRFGRPAGFSAVEGEA